MEVDISRELNIVKNEEYGEVVIGGITDALDILVDQKFKGVDISTEENTMKTSPSGAEIKQSIIDALYTLSKVEHIEPVETEYFTTDEPFSAVNNLKRCEIPEGTLRIDDYAFEDAVNLRTVEIPEGVTTIGIYAFNNCEMLNNVVIPEGVVTVGTKAFAHCSSIEELTLPESLMYGRSVNASRDDSQMMLSGCKSLRRLIIKNPGDLSVELKTVQVRCGRTYDVISGTYVQQYQERYTGEYKDNGNRYTCLKDLCGGDSYQDDDPNDPREWNTSLTYVELPDDMDVIYQGMFRGCTNLVLRSLPSGVTIIGSEAFEHCRSITSDSIFRSASFLGGMALSDTGIEYFDTSAYPIDTVIAGNVISSPGDIYEDADYEYAKYYTNTNLKTAIIDYRRTSNGDPYDDTRTFFTFDNCVALERVDHPIYASDDAPENYTFGIGSMTQARPSGTVYNTIYGPRFTNCYNLEYVSLDGRSAVSGEVRMPLIDHFTSIGNSTFRRCRKITKLSNIYKDMSYPPPLKYIGKMAFYGSGLTEFYIPPACIYVGNQAFAECTNLTKVDIDPDTCNWEVTSNNGYSQYVFSGCASLTSFEIPYKWSCIPAGAFKDCTSLNSITFKPAATSIESYALSNTAFATLAIPTTVKSISSYAFYGCANLTSISASGVTSLAYNAFEDCTALTSISHGAITSYASKVFKNTGFVSYTVPASVTSIGTNCFESCQNLESVTTTSVQSINGNAFKDCTALTEVNISSTIRTINSSAFSGCDGITFNIDRKTNAVTGYNVGWGATNYTINWTGTA